MLRTTASWRDGSKTTARPLPSPLATYIAMSASRISVSAVVTPLAPTAMPMLAAVNRCDRRR